MNKLGMISGPQTQEVATLRLAEWVATAGYLPNPDQVLRKMGRSTVAIYRELLTDARVGAAVESRKAGIKSLDYEIQQNGSDDVAFQFVKETFEHLDVPRILGEILNAPLYGYQPMERIWMPDGGRYALADLVGKPPEWFVYGLDAELRFRKVGQLIGDEVPPLSFQVARHEADYRNPYGIPILSRCWWPIVFKRGGVKFWAVFAEKWGMPHAMAYLGDVTDKKKVDEWLDKLEALVQDGIGVFGNNGKVELMEAGGKTAGGALYGNLIDWANSEVTTALLGHQGATSSTPGKLGSEQMADTTRDDIVWTDKNLCQSQLNLLIRDLYRLNFGESKAFPKFCFYEKEEVDITRTERDAKLQTEILTPMGLQFSLKYLQEKHGLAEDDLEDAPEKAPPPSLLQPPPQPPVPLPIPPPAPAPDPATLSKGHPPHVKRRDPKAETLALQSLLDGIPEKDMQGFSQDALVKVIELVKKAEGYDEVKAGLAKLLPNMNTAQFETVLGKAVWLSELLGSAA